jgi:hypothetical protein
MSDKKTTTPPISVYVRDAADPLFHQVEAIQRKLKLRSRSDAMRTAVAYLFKAISEET